MRLSALTSETLLPDARVMHDEMQELIAKHLNNFVTARPDGALIGPFSPMLHYPRLGRPAWDLIRQLIAHAGLPTAAREVAVLITGARFNARYEIYSHEHVAEKSGLPAGKIATLSVGERPGDLTRDEAAAFDVASALLRGNQLPETTYQRAIMAFGEDGFAELVFLVGGYAVISLLLNAYDISVPGREEGLPDEQVRLDNQ